MMIRSHSRVWSVLFVAMCITLPMLAAAQDATGVWRTEATDQGYLEISVTPCAAALCGTILRARDLQGREQPYPHVGRWMIRDMIQTGPGNWDSGQIWDPRNDRTFRSRMALSGEQLVVSGCVLGFCQSQSWTRIE